MAITKFKKNIAIDFDGSPKDRINYYNNDPRKIGCDEFWADKAVPMPFQETDSYWIGTIDEGVHCAKCETFSDIPSKHCPICDSRMINAHCIK